MSADLDKLISFIERDHGGCDQHTCTLSIAMKNDYPLIAIDHWIGSGAACADFTKEAQKGLPYTFKALQKERAKMTRELEHVQCPNCNSVIWLPDDCGHHCDNCGHDLEECPCENTA